MRDLLLIIIVLSIALPSSVFSQTQIYTLYRNSVLDPSMRIHIASLMHLMELNIIQEIAG